MKTIAVAHHKGGVGKTTTTAHLGHALAVQGQRVLLVDLDPQASLTRLLGHDSPGECGFGAAVTQGGSLVDHVSHVSGWGLDVLPASQRLARLERGSEPGLEQQLRIMLSESPADRWDVVLIDAPGALGPLTITALVAATHGVIVPTTPDYLALDPIRAILDLIRTVRQAYQPGCELRGVVINNWTHTVDHRENLLTLRSTFARQVLGEIPKRAAIGDAAATGRPLTSQHTGPAAALRDAYTEIAATVTAPETAMA